MLEELIKKYLIESAGISPNKFDDPDLLVADLELDSLALIEMLFEVEDQFGFQIPDPMIFVNMRFAEMVSTMEAMAKAHTEAAAAKSTLPIQA
jgi:acyl carrier protein